MNTPKFSSKSLLTVLVVILAFSLTGCGEAWTDAYNPAIDVFNTAVTRLNKQIDIVSNDNSKVSDDTWKSETKSALAALKEASQGLKNLPTPEDATLKEVNVLVKQLAIESIAAVDGYNALIAAEDMNLVDSPNAHMDEINKILPKINKLIDKYEE